MTLTQLFTNIANAIRSKKGTSALIQAEDFPNEIITIEAGGNEEIFSIGIDYRPTINTSAWASAKIPLNKVLSEINQSSLSIYDGGIKIGEGVDRVKVSARICYWNYNATGEVDLIILKNSTDVIHIYDSCKVANQIDSINLNPVVLDVEQNDILYLYIVKGDNANMTILENYATNMTAEVV